jgi:hypothetical protein
LTPLELKEITSVYFLKTHEGNMDDYHPAYVSHFVKNVRVVIDLDEPTVEKAAEAIYLIRNKGSWRSTYDGLKRVYIDAATHILEAINESSTVR